MMRTSGQSAVVPTQAGAGDVLPPVRPVLTPDGGADRRAVAPVPEPVEAIDGLLDRAAALLGAPTLLVLDAGGRRVSGSRGWDAARAAEITAHVTAGRDAGPDVVVVPVASSRRHHGHLAVPAGTAAAAVRACADHAASALDLLAALDEARREERRSAALLTLARELAGARDAPTVGRLVATAMPPIVGCTSASVMLWDPSEGALQVVASTGLDAEREAVFARTEVRADQTPELAALLTAREVVLHRTATASPQLAALLAALDLHTVIVVPLVAGDTLLGVATASWSCADGEVVETEELLTRIEGVAIQAATALQNAWLQAAVQHGAEHDSLTGLPNRWSFGRRLADALRGAHGGTGTAVLSCDLDRFRQVNQSLGHSAGDEVLRQAAARMRGVLRPLDTVGRLGGDEFAVLLRDVADDAQVLAVARRLVEVLDEPFRIEGRELRITSSIGVALHRGPDGRAERLLGAAVAALGSAKGSGRHQVVLAGAVAGEHVTPSLEAELAHAVTAGQLRLFFQPVVDVSGERTVVVGAEALLRWAHPRLGLVGPAAFLPLAEEAGLVSDLDLWAVRAACEALAGWSAAGRELRMAVNLAGATLVDPRLVPTVRAALRATGLSPDRLHLEVVESRSLEDLPRLVERLVELRRMGVRISLDDFGTGYSTMAWLQALPVDQIKIDRTFIKTLPDVGALALVRGLLALAGELGIEVIAEGVERDDQLQLLRQAGCVMVQGYLLGRPAPVLDPSAVYDG